MAKILLFLLLAAFYAMALHHLYCLKRQDYQMRPILLCCLIALIIAPLGELVVNTLYMALMGHQLWAYQFFPIGPGHVSWAAPLIWFSYGLNFYLGQIYFHKKSLSPIYLVAALGVEALV
jgi:hypothetical protein